MTSTITTQYVACPSGTIAVNVKRSGSNVNGATVTVTLGPNNISYTGTTNSSGNVSFSNVPSGTGYTVKAWNCSVSTPKGVTQTGVSVSTGATTSLNLSFANGTCPQ
jgi:hypothetical protein